MRILLLNLPSETPMVRRYMCSSFAERFLFPPHDLLALASVARAAGNETHFLDAIAEDINLQGSIEYIRQLQPQLIVSIMSFELFDKDADLVKAIKATFPEINYGVFGHYPSHFAKETLSITNADFIMLGEPDHIFERVLAAWQNGAMPTTIEGTVVNSNKEVIQNGEDRRVPNPNILPMPAYDLLKQQYYKEPFMPNPTGVIQSARGCPYKCNYCVHSFGTKLTVLTPENVMEHILFIKEHHGIKSLRFIDDTFTAVPSRVIKLCKLMIEANLNLPWTCLSRADTLDEEMLQWMKRAGCTRLNIGFESGSQRVLDALNKGVVMQDQIPAILKAKALGFEILGFFLTGIPEETEEDINMSIALAKKTCDFIVVDSLKVYPGTPLYDRYEKLVTFSLNPYRNFFTDAQHNKIAEQRRSKMYRSFYFSPRFLFKAPAMIFTDSSLKEAIPYVFKMALKRS